MAYVSNALSEFGATIGGRSRLWIYNTADTLTAVQATGYISDAGSKRMLVGDLVMVFSGTLSTLLTATPTTIAAGVTSEFATSGTPIWQPMLCTAVSNLDSKGGASSTSAATLTAVTFQNLDFPRNMFDGGDATVNPWQRGTTISGIVATNTYTADRWFVVAGAATSASVVKTADTTVPGFSQSFVLSRASGQSSVSAITFGQALESLDSIRAQGQPVTLSFWARTNSGYTGGSLSVTLAQGTGTDQSVSALVNGTWTTQTNVISATQALTATATRYAFTGTVGNTATQLGAFIAWTPVGTNTGNDGLTLNGFQLEVGSGATPFEHRDVELELALCQRYFFQINETSTAIVANGVIEAANAATFWLSLPTQMRAAPTVTVTAGSFAQQVSGTTAAVSGFAAGATHTVNYITVVSTATATAGLGALLLSRQTNSGTIAASADL